MKTSPNLHPLADLPSTATLDDIDLFIIDLLIQGKCAAISIETERCIVTRNEIARAMLVPPVHLVLDGCKPMLIDTHA